MPRLGWIVLVLGAALAGVGASAGEKTADAPLVIVDAQGKDVKVKGWRATVGFRRLPLDGNKGPLYLEFRDEHSTTFQNGILTFIPLTSLRRLDYDNDKKTVTAVVAVGDKDVTLKGTTKYNGINRLTIEGDADLGELGFASVKFQAGNPKGGLRSVRFPSPEPLPARKVASGNSATILGADKEKSRHAIAEPTVLYQLAAGNGRFAPQLYFKKTVKIELAKLSSLRHLEPEDKKQPALDFELTLKTGEKLNLTLLTKVDLDGKPATLSGVFGRVPVGYQLFPPHTIAELSMAAKNQE